jgi:SGNH hydrolase-like domain, acetyltransferase AlgX
MDVRSHFRCGYLIPRLLLLWALLDVGLRFAPPRWFAFRMHEYAMITGIHSLGALRTDLTYDNPHVYGDLAALGNCISCRQYHAESFHTDALGFPNPPATSKPYDAILVGDSFAVGAEQHGGTTLAARISSDTGLSIYNASTLMRAMDTPKILSLITRLGMSHGTVFFELMDDSLGHSRHYEPPDRFHRWLMNAQFSPLANISKELIDRLQNDQVLPNPFTHKVVRKVLPNDHVILFNQEDLWNCPRDSARFWAAYLTSLDAALKQRHFQLVVILVPNKYTVYQPLLKDAPPTNRAAMLHELAENLDGIPIVNTTPALQQAAADELRHDSFLYWLDDTHWNEEGVRVAVDDLTATLFPPQHPADAQQGLMSVSQKKKAH